jgi:hypothetical protein
LKLYDAEGRELLRSRGVENGIAWWDGIDPRWRKVTVEFEVAKLGAPPGATGRFAQQLVFDKVPLPTTVGQPLEVNRTLETKHGGQIVLEKVLLQKTTPDAPSLLYLVIRTVAPPDVPDLDMRLSLEPSGVSDDKGTNLTPRFFVFPRRAPQEYGAKREMIEVTEPPAFDARSVNVTMNVRELAPSLKQPQWFQHVRFDLDPSGLKPDTSAAEPPPALAVAATESVEVAVQKIKTRPRPAGSAGIWHELEFWLTSKEPLTSGQWTIEKVEAQDDAGNKYFFDKFNVKPLVWAPDGSVARRSSMGYRVTMPSVGGQGDPTKLSLRVEVRPLRVIRHEIEYSQVPIPPVGQILPVRLAKSTESGAKLILWKLGHFTPEHPVPTGTKYVWPEMASALLPWWSGVAAVFEYRPAPGDDVQGTLQTIEATDNNGTNINFGRPLRGPQGATSYLGSTWKDALKLEDTPPGQWFTVYWTPAVASKNINLRMLVAQDIAGGENESVSLADVPLPAAAR